MPAIRFAAAVSLLLGVAACRVGNSADAASTGSSSAREPVLRVVTTVAPITSIVSAVAGDRAEIDGIVPEGTNSHTFEPPPSAARMLSEADVIFVNGLRLEDPTKKLAEANKKLDASIVELGTTVLPESEWIYDFSFPKQEGKPNPHLWTDPTYAIKYAAVARDALIKVDAAGAREYEANFAAFEKKATALSDAIKSDQTSLRPDQRELLTYHDAYAYFARSYGWKVIGAIQPHSFEEPTPKEMARLIDQVEAEKVTAIFGSEVFPSKALEEIGEATGAVYEDSLRDDDLPGSPGDAEHSWLGLMRYDFRTLISRLGGTTRALDELNTRPAVTDDAHYPQ